MEQRAWLYRLGISLWLCTCGYVAAQGASSGAKYNAAFNQSTWQSSWNYKETAPADKPNYGRSLKAVDGNTDADFGQDSCTHTAGAATGTIYWSVDLGTPQRVQSVKLYNRLKSFGRLQRFSIYGTTDGHTPDDARGKQTCASQTTPALGRGASKDFTCEGKLIARYIIVEKTRLSDGEDILSLCEAQVYVCSDQNCANCTEARCEACDSGYRTHNGGCSECSAGYYGYECRHTCSGNCKDNADCDKVTGECLDCADGYYGERCSQPCSEHCKDNAVCLKVTGNCPQGECEPGYRDRNCSKICRDGKYGDRCAKDCSSYCTKPQECDHITGYCSVCVDGYTGVKCEKTCPSNCRTQDCDQGTGHCVACEDGYTGEKCETPCPLGKYGENCAGVCSGHCADGHGNNCDNIDGSCRSCQPGYQGDKCDSACDAGKYGDRCEQICPSTCRTQACDHVTGHCLACANGLTGDMCQHACPLGSYGEDCAGVCSGHCAYGDGNNCNKIDGSCQSCQPGYQGLKCDSACNSGKYGQKCRESCSENCKNSGVCEHIDGHCDCREGYKGDTCNDPCSAGSYGKGCGGSCSGHCLGGHGCNHIDGKCPENSKGLIECEAGYKGDKCHKEIEPVNLNMVGAFIMIGLIVILVVVLGFLLIAWKRWGWFTGKDKPDKSASNELKPFLNNNSEDVESRRGGSSLPPSRPPPPPCSQSPRGKPSTTPKPPITPKPVGRAGSKNKLNLEISTDSASLYENAAKSIEDIESAVTTYIKLDEIGAYIKRKRDLLQAEYKSIPTEVHPCFYGISLKLKDKNRYKNIIPYDKNRVKLQQKGSDKLSDYINASYVKDYRGKVAYIAALGTTGMTITDFWRMIWEQEVEVIVMVTQLMEEDRMKCVQYWPADRENRYGDVKVEIQDTENTPYYVLRSYQVSQGKKSRVIRHYQYTCWPDKGVPERGTGLSQLREIMKQHREAHTSPIIVHCSAGVGRTGTLIALDILLDQAAAEQAVDIYKTVCDLRDQRTNMVQTLDQYEYIHDFLHEVLTVKKTVIACDRLEGFLESQESQGVLERQYQFLEDSKPGLSIIEKQIFREDRDRNRYSQIVPVDVKRAKIPCYPEIYVNAAYVEGYKEKTAYVSTQVPMATTAADFWHLMYDLKCTSLVCLQQDKQYTQWLPEGYGSINHGQYTIMCVTVIQAEDGVTERQLTIKLNKEDKVEYSNTNTRDSVQEEEFAPLDLHVYELPAWNHGPPEGDVATSVINLYVEVQRWQQRNTNKLITVMCMDGATESGLLLACWHLFDMANIEQEVDVFHVVKLIRKSRPQFVPSLAQYRQIHSVVKQYIDSFGSYSNFRVMDI